MSPISPYASFHESLNGPGDQRPTAQQIIRDYGLEGKWTGRVVLITGASPGGLGVEIARAMHSTGANVVITVRDPAKGDEVVKDIMKDGGQGGKVEGLTMDLASFASVKKAAETFLAKYQKLNVLINNAAVMACPKGLTEDGFETQLGTNFIGHFLFFHLLKPTLLASSTSSLNSRVICVSSGSHRASTINFADPHFATITYDAHAAYAQSKLANILFANGIDRRYGAKGLHALSANPGGIKTNLQQHSAHIRMLLDTDAARPLLKSVEQGAATIVWAAVAKEWEGNGGRYVEDCGEAGPGQAGNPYAGYSQLAYDVEAEKKLWEQALLWVGLEDDS